MSIGRFFVGRCSSVCLTKCSLLIATKSTMCNFSIIPEPYPLKNTIIGSIETYDNSAISGNVGSRVGEGFKVKLLEYLSLNKSVILIISISLRAVSPL